MRNVVLAVLAALTVLAVLCCVAVVGFILLNPATGSNWTRRDMPTEGLSLAVTYNLRGTAGSDREVNYAQLRGVNENAPTLMQEVRFDRMSGSKTQDVSITLPDGRVVNTLGMIKTERFAGLTHYMDLESATFSGVDYAGNIFCGAKIRLQFNRNLVQRFSTGQRDYDSLWYYDIPCSKDGAEFNLELENATLRSITINEVWQFRIASGSHFFNWGHSVVVVGGPAADLTGGWWQNWDQPNDDSDAMGAADILNRMVKDLESSPEKWLDFNPNGEFSDAHTIYSAGDADQYANLQRLLENRQREYVVFYRPNKETPWDFVTIRPIYNYEWNDAGQILAGIRGWNRLDPLQGRLNDQGLPKDANDPVVKEIERIGWSNAPNASLEQIQFVGSDGTVLYTMTVRAFIGAQDTLVMWGLAAPPSISQVENQGTVENMPRPILYDNKGNPLPENQQSFTSAQWAEWQRESSMWNFIKDNPDAVGADLAMQYRFVDNSTWSPITCTDSDGKDYTCGYNPVEWNLSTSYYFDDGNVREAWLVMNLLGEVGVRTLGLSYASGQYQGTGTLFAMAQVVNYNEFFAGYGPESLYNFDSRAAVLPTRLEEAWGVLHQ